MISLDLRFFKILTSYAGFRLTCRFAAMPRDHRLLFQSCSSQRQRRFDFITERHRSRVE